MSDYFPTLGFRNVRAVCISFTLMKARRCDATSKIAPNLSKSRFARRCNSSSLGVTLRVVCILRLSVVFVLFLRTMTAECFGCGNCASRRHDVYYPAGGGYTRGGPFCDVDVHFETSRDHTMHPRAALSRLIYSAEGKITELRTKYN